MERAAPVRVMSLPNALLAAATKGDTAAVVAWLRDGGSVDAQNGARMTLRMAASLHGREELSATLLGAGASVDLQNLNGDTALFYACTKNHPSIVRQLLAAGADHWAITSKLRGERRMHLQIDVLDLIRDHAGGQLFAGGDDRMRDDRWRPGGRHNDPGSPEGRRWEVGGSSGKSSGPPVTTLLPVKNWDEKSSEYEVQIYKYC
mgnify:CR=1 FL=1